MVYTNDTKTEKLAHTFQVHIEQRLLPTQFITEKPQNETVKLGDSWSFKCPLADPSLEVNYYRKVNLLTTNTSGLPEAEVGNSTEDGLHFAHVFLNDKGWYSCRVLDQNSQDAAASAYLTVIDLSWYEENKTLLAVIGTAVFCFCAAVIVIHVFRELNT
ncbi:uncharacterized protein LOC135843480 [Planococcus citri]|uniref:uncharacterized protein LOC135843480 n=1 Tax=Planococcus citri TaxID=170843 RepID=UPI0031F871C7